MKADKNGGFVLELGQSAAIESKYRDAASNRSTQNGATHSTPSNKWARRHTKRLQRSLGEEKKPWNFDWTWTCAVKCVKLPLDFLDIETSDKISNFSTASLQSFKYATMNK